MQSHLEVAVSLAASSVQDPFRAIALEALSPEIKCCLCWVKGLGCEMGAIDEELGRFKQDMNQKQFVVANTPYAVAVISEQSFGYRKR